MTNDSKKNRDLYLQYVRLSNPDYAVMSREEVRVLVGNATKPKVKVNKNKPKRGYKCCTQRNDGTADIYLGLNRGKLSLWENGSTINWTARTDGYPNDMWRIQSVIAFWQACMTWNEVMEDRVKFRYVGNLTDAAIELRYNPDSTPGLLASAFFPDEGDRDLNFVHVYESQFDPRYNTYAIYNTYLHEIGHVLGLRHEFSHIREDNAFIESILFGVNNERSVMAYYPSQEIQDTDVDHIRKAYDELTDGSVITGQGRFGTITKTVDRVVPNN